MQDDSESSVSEFWETIDSPIGLHKKQGDAVYKQNEMTTIESNQSNIQPTLDIANYNFSIQNRIQMIYNTDNFHEAVTRMRKAQSQELKQLQIKLIKEKDLQHNEHIKKIINNFKIRIEELKKLYEKTSNQLYIREQELKQLMKAMTDQEIVICQYRDILSEVWFFNTQDQQKMPNTDSQDEKQGYIDQIKKVQQQYETMRQTVKIYHSDVVKYQMKMDKVISDQQKVEQEYQERLDEQERIHFDKQQRLTGELHSLKIRFEELQRNSQKEVQVYELIKDKHEKTIQSLQDELKNAKMVLQNPRLRSVYHEKLSEYMSDHTKSHKKQTKSSRQRIRTTKSTQRTTSYNFRIRNNKSVQKSLAEISYIDTNITHQYSFPTEITNKNTVFSLPGHIPRVSRVNSPNLNLNANQTLSIFFPNQFINALKCQKNIIIPIQIFKRLL